MPLYEVKESRIVIATREYLVVPEAKERVDGSNNSQTLTPASMHRESKSPIVPDEIAFVPQV
jgi:hypothetical protein